MIMIIVIKEIIKINLIYFLSRSSSLLMDVFVTFTHTEKKICFLSDHIPDINNICMKFHKKSMSYESRSFKKTTTNEK